MAKTATLPCVVCGTPVRCESTLDIYITPQPCCSQDCIEVIESEREFEVVASTNPLDSFQRSRKPGGHERMARQMWDMNEYLDPERIAA